LLSEHNAADPPPWTQDMCHIWSQTTLDTRHMPQLITMSNNSPNKSQSIHCSHSFSPKKSYDLSSSFSLSADCGPWLVYIGVFLKSDPYLTSKIPLDKHLVSSASKSCRYAEKSNITSSLKCSTKTFTKYH